MTRIMLVLCLALWAAPALAVTLPTLPATVDTTYPTINGGVTVSSCANLQADINTIAALSTALNYEITVPAGSSCQGPFFQTARAAGATGWIVIRTTGIASLPAGTRVSAASVSNMFTIVSDSGSNYFAAVWGKSGGHHYRWVGVDFVQHSTVDTFAMIQTMSDAEHGGVHHLIYDRIRIVGSTGRALTRGIQLYADGGHVAVLDSEITDIKHPTSDSQAILGVITAGPILYRNNHLEAAGENIMFCGGTPALSFRDSNIDVSTNEITVRGESARWVTGQLTRLGGDYAIMPTPLVKRDTDYYVIKVSGGTTSSVIKLATSLANAQAGTAIDITDKGQYFDGNTNQPCTSDICGYSLSNENVMPHDITIKNNWFTKRPEWHHATTQPWITKTHIETKCGVRVDIDGNIIEKGLRYDGGTLFRFTVRNESGYAPWSEVADITMRHNIIRYGANLLTIFGADDQSGGGNRLYDSKATKRVHFYNNLIYGIGFNPDIGPNPSDLCVSGSGASCGAGFSVFSGSTTCTENVDCRINDLTIAHNTMDWWGSTPGPTAAYFMCVTTNGHKRLLVKDNIFEAGTGRGVFDCGGGTSANYGTTRMNEAWGAGTSNWQWLNNSLASSNGFNGEGFSSYPDGSLSCTSSINCYYSSGTSFGYTNRTARDYTLAGGSPLIDSASEGGTVDRGVIWADFNASQAGGSGGSGSGSSSSVGGISGTIRFSGSVRIQ